MKKLVIAEKPSLAMTIVRAIGGSFNKKDGYFENENYIVTFAFGHLFELFSLDDYFNREKTKWKLERLPFLVEEYKFKLKNDTGVKKQFNIIKELINRNDVSEIINCGDADREGQVIINLIINNALETNKEVKRLWLPEQTEESIRYELNNLKDNGNYINLYNEGLVRTYVDWLYGINLTQFVSLKKNSLFPIGRVIIPIVEVIANRDKEIENFTPQKYYQAEINFIKDGVNLKLTLNDKFNNEFECRALVESLKDKNIVVKDIENKDIKKQPKKLFSLDKLQNKLSKDYKLSAKESLSIIQRLYENGYVTYPRTNTEYLAEEEKKKVEKVIQALDKNNILELKNKNSIFDSSKIESHSAIIPTTKIPTDLAGMDLKVYNTIKNRFISNFLVEDCILSETKVIFEFAGYELKLKGTVIKQKGFLEYENDMKEKSIPRFEKDESIKPNIEVAEKKTTPPKHISLEELNNYLKNPFKKDDMTEDEEYNLMLDGVEIGTVATRGSIIENACKYKYITENKGTFYITEKGKELMKALNELNIDMFKNKTVELSKVLKKVYKKELSKDEAMKIYSNDLESMINNAKGINVDKYDYKTEKEIIGICPRCKKNIYEGEKNYYCEGYKEGCKFTVWKNNKFFTDKGKKLTKAMVKKFLEGKKVKVKGFIKKDGTGKYDAYVSMEDTGTFVNFKLDFTK
ncbi:DNA topoisomerase (plasmid) [Clostridium baratii]